MLFRLSHSIIVTDTVFRNVLAAASADLAREIEYIHNE